MLSILELREILSYDPQTGDFVWLKDPPRGTKRAGQIAGTIHPDGNTFYRSVKVKGKDHKAHRLAWFYMYGVWPSLHIDHRDGDGLNNRIANLREATTAENARNRGATKTGTSGFKGVSFNGRCRKWKSQIRVNSKLIHLGYFPTQEQAHAAYVAAAEKHHGEFARVA